MSFQVSFRSMGLGMVLGFFGAFFFLSQQQGYDSNAFSNSFGSEVGAGLALSQAQDALKEMEGKLKTLSAQLSDCRRPNIEESRFISRDPAINNVLSPDNVAYLPPEKLVKFKDNREKGINRFIQGCARQGITISRHASNFIELADQCMNKVEQFGETWWSRFGVVFPCEDVKETGTDFLQGNTQKWVCRHSQLKAGCIVYSWGSNGDTLFEKGILKDTPCEVHVFDPTLDDAKMAPINRLLTRNPGRAFFYDLGVTGPNEAEVNSYILSQFHISNIGIPKSKFKTFSEIITMLKHDGKTIDILKVDIEAHEIMLLTEPDSSFENVNQILVEIHLKFFVSPTKYFSKLMEKMERNHFYLFHSEINPQCWAYCFEFSFIKYRPSLE